MAYNKETGMYDGWIYLLTDKNGRQYVGQTTQASISVRVHQHFTNNPSNTNSRLDYTMHKYGKEIFGYLLIITGSKNFLGILFNSILLMLYITFGSNPMMKNC